MYIENDEELDGEWVIEETGEPIQTAFNLFQDQIFVEKRIIS